MIKKQFISDQSIIDCLNAHYEIKVTTLTHIPLGADIDASVYKAETYNQLSYFVKLKRGHFDDIGTLIQLELHATAIQHIISPIKTNHDQPTCHIDDFTLIVYPFIKGQDGFSQDLNKNQWITLGKTLRQIHDFHLSPLLQNQIKQESYSQKWQKIVRSIYIHIDTEAKITDKTALKLLTFMTKHKKIIQRLVDRAEQLGQKIQQQSPKLVLCHSDIHGGNVLIANDETLYIVDWDQPIMAPKERDLMFIGGGIANIWNNAHEEKFFYSGYGTTDINKEILSYYRHERIVEDIAIYSEQLLLTTDGSEDREIMYKHFIDMFKPRGVVDIAFKTDTDL